MADISIEILAMNDTLGGKYLNFFEKGLLMLNDCSEDMAEDVKACLFWWIFTQEEMEDEVQLLIKCG